METAIRGHACPRFHSQGRGHVYDFRVRNQRLDEGVRFLMGDEQTTELKFDSESDDQDVSEQLIPGSVAAVVSGTDWTTETIITQLQRGNIQLNPGFQRRDAWNRNYKSRFIESLIVGLPIPQIVLAESKKDRGKFIVLDGKQRLLSILQFWGLDEEGKNNAYRLSGLTLRPDLKGKSFKDLSESAALEADFDALCNQPIRTVVIRNWRDNNFLHTVFLRLNTGSVKLSPQELRQALIPGAFTDHIDVVAGGLAGLRSILGIDAPHSRMRDTEILARFLAFRFFAITYPGRMAAFLDTSFEKFNADWETHQPKVDEAVLEFESGVAELIRVFNGALARKPESVQFNRAVFDALIYFHSQPTVREALVGKDDEVRAAYLGLFVEGSSFLQAIESDTAGAPNTLARLTVWGAALSEVAGVEFAPPAIPVSRLKNESGAEVGSCDSPE